MIIKPEELKIVYEKEDDGSIRPVYFIEAEPIRHGRWIPQDHNKSNGFVTTSVYYFPKCSECGHSGESAFAFCPHCGAKMDGGGDDADKSVRA